MENQDLSGNPKFEQTSQETVYESTVPFDNEPQKEKIDVTIVYVLSIISFFLCCCSIGFIPAIISYIISRKKVKQYKENPEAYYNYPQIKNADIFALVVMILSLLVFLYTLYELSFNFSSIMEAYQRGLDEYNFDSK